MPPEAICANCRSSTCRASNSIGCFSSPDGAPLKIVAFSLTALLALPAFAEGMRRFAVVAGNDEGGDDTRPLLYARDDARKIHEILTRLGGIRPGDSEIVPNGKAPEPLASLARA